MPTKQKKKQDITAVGKALRALGGLGGGYAGGLFGNPAMGSAAGTGFGAMVSKWLGQGDYTVSSNSLVSQVRPDGTIPSMHKDGQTVVVRHKEFLGEILSSASYTVQRRFPLNPGDINTFPWLSAIAAQYTEYKIRGMVFHYIPTSGTAINSTNPALGSVMIQTSYRATEDPPASKVEMMNEYWATEARPSDPFVHPIECDPKENPFNVQYIRNASVSNTENILMYDLGVTTVATTGCPASNNIIGDLWCTYEIELKKPKLAQRTMEGTETVSIISQGSTNPAQPFESQRQSFVNIPGVSDVTATGITLDRFASGTFLVEFEVAGGSATAPVIGIGPGITLPLGPFTNAAGASSVVSAGVIRVVPSTASRVIGCTLGTLSGAGNVTRFRMTEYNSQADF